MCCRVGSRREDLHNYGQPSSAYFTSKLNVKAVQRGDS